MQPDNQNPSLLRLARIFLLPALILFFLLIFFLCRLIPTTRLPADATQTPAQDDSLPAAPSEPAPTRDVAPIDPGQLSTLQWITGIIDPGPQVGIFSDLFISTQGTLYAAYLDDQNDALKVAVYEGVDWTTRTALTSENSEGWYPSFAQDDQGGLHLASFSYLGQRILYGSLVGSGEWAFETAVEGAQVQDLTLLIGPGNRTLVVYYDQDAAEVRIVERGEGGWSAPASISSAQGESGYYPAAIAPDGQIHVLYAGISGGLWHAASGEGGWSTKVVDQSGTSIYYPALAFDRQGGIHASYYDSGKRALIYAARTGEEWARTTVDEEGEPGRYSAIAVDQHGNIHICYYAAQSQSLRYALGAPAEDGTLSWTKATIDDQGNPGHWSSLVLDQDENPWISYLAGEKQELRYAYGSLRQSSVHQPVISVVHRSGQSFLSWKENLATSGEVYRIYRSNEPVSAASLPQAQFLAEVGENSARIWANFFVSDGIWSPRLTDRMVFADNVGPLHQGTGALVWTLGAEDFGGGSTGQGYYAVTIKQPGGEETFLPEYTAGPVDESVAPPAPVEISDSTGVRPGPGGHYYLQYMDLRTWNPTFHAPNKNNQYYGFDPSDPSLSTALAYVYDYSVFEPTPELCGGQVPDTLPVMVFLHGARGNRYGTPDKYPYPYCAYGVYPIDQSETWYFGFARSHDYRTDDPVGEDDVIVNYTEQRVLRMVADLMRNPPGKPVDPQRVYLFGHSMGGTGSMAMAQRYPNVFAAVYSGQPVTWFRPTDGVTESWPGQGARNWGDQALNLPIAISAPENWAAHLQKYNGVGVFDWEDLPSAFDSSALPDRSADDMAPFAVDHGTADDSVKFRSQAERLYPILMDSNRTWAGAITGKSHEWSVFGWALPNLGKVNDVPFYNLSVIRDETIPGLSVASTDRDGDPEGEVIPYNQGLLWSASWNAWDGPPVDEPEEWQMSFCAVAAGSTTCGTGEAFSIDITPRRLQSFQPIPGVEYAWENIQVRDGSVVDQGTVSPSANGLITVRGFQVSPEGNRLRIWKK